MFSKDGKSFLYVSKAFFLNEGSTLLLLKTNFFPSVFLSACILIVEGPFHIWRYGHDYRGCRSIGHQVLEQLHRHWTDKRFIPPISSLVLVTSSNENTINNNDIIGIIVISIIRVDDSIIIVISVKQTSNKYDTSVVLTQTRAKASLVSEKLVYLLSPGLTQDKVIVNGNGLTSI